ncbi:hypothetical protein DH2020_031005 [Rehmannia glutinosa]|uniref:Uncharacterized protein n=1 Tax=Rehmannia glutinosa TaxID=99300 RepID=A0ABR0VJ64_REHGL
MALASSLPKPGVWTLPQFYVKAGAALLVKAWIVDKDAEALRCQKLLVEEEEAAQKSAFGEEKQKKLRQKEQKVKEQFDGCSGDLDVNVDALDRPTSAEASGPPSPSDSNSNPPDMPTNLNSSSESMQPQSKELDENSDTQFDISSEHIKQGDSQATKLQMVGANGSRHLATNRWQVPKSQRGGRDGENLKPPPSQGETNHQIEENNCEVIIGSISVTLKSSVAQQQDSRPDEAQDICSSEQKKNVSEKVTKANPVQFGNNRVASKHWRPVRHGETKSISPVDRGNEDSEGGAMLKKVHDRILSSERSEQSQSRDYDCDNGEQYHVLSNENVQRGYLPFSSTAAKEFLSQRWKEAISADHVTLVLSEPEPPGCSDVQLEPSTISNVSDPPENHLGRSIQVKLSKKPEKSVKIKYIPKQKAIA